jgi:Ala-tRNA(Pro) deacylase
MLEQRGVAYDELHHRVAFTAQEVAQSEHVSGHRLAKVVVVMADSRPVELILPASRRVVLDRVAKLLDADHVRLASEAEMDRIFTDCQTGAIPPLRHWKGVAVLMDASMSNARDLVFQAGTHEDAIRLRFPDWLALVNPRVECFAEPDHGPSGHVRQPGGRGVRGMGRAGGSAVRGGETRERSAGRRKGTVRRSGIVRGLSGVRPLSRGGRRGVHAGRVCPRPAR